MEIEDQEGAGLVDHMNLAAATHYRVPREAFDIIGTIGMDDQKRNRLSPCMAVMRAAFAEDFSQEALNVLRYLLVQGYTLERHYMNQNPDHALMYAVRYVIPYQ